MSTTESNSDYTEQRVVVSSSGPRRLGKYELIARIGEGGMAEVYLARQRGPMDFEKVVVVKTIHPHLGRKKKFTDMLLDEARIAARLKHPCVVDIYDLGIEGETYFIAMEHLAGETLLAVLRACVKKKQLDVPCTARIIADVADGLHAAHELKDSAGKPLDLVHRDITPGNIVVLYTGQVKILDFGIAKARGRLSDETDADHFKGKLGYIAPEQVKGQSIDRRSDIFSLGVVMWEALALRRLFRKSNPAAAADAILKAPIPPPSKYRSAVPPKLDAICMRALARDPGERYATAADMQEDIERFLSAGSFRPHKAAIRKYMCDVFADRMEAREQIVHRVVVATSEFLVQPLVRHSTDPDMEIPAGDGVDSIEIEVASGQWLEHDLPRASTGSELHGENTPSVMGEQLSGPMRGLPLHAVPEASKPFNKRLWAGLGAAALLIVIVLAITSGGDKSAAEAGEKSAGATAGASTAADTNRAQAALDQTAEPVLAQAGQAVQAVQANGQPGEPLPGTDNSGNNQPGGQEIGSEHGQDSGEEGSPAAGDEPAQGSSTEAGSDTEEQPDDGKSDSSRPANVKRKKSEPSRADPKALYDQGIKQFISGNLSGAKSKFYAALKARPGYAAAYRGLGMVYERQGQKAKAADAFRKYLRLSPGASDSQFIRKRLAALGG